MEIEVLQLASAIGAEIKCGDVKRLDHEAFTKIQRAFLDHLVLLIRDQQLNDDDLLAFGRRFGELSRPSPVHIGQKPRDEKYPEIAVISNVIENGVAIGGLGDGEAVWHTDSAFNEVPPSCSILYAIELPPSGGDTGFANMYLALETLPASLRSAIADKTIKHDKRYTSGGQLRPGYLAEQDLRTSPGLTHPIIRRHPETGRSALYLGAGPMLTSTACRLLNQKRCSIHCGLTRRSRTSRGITSGGSGTSSSGITGARCTGAMRSIHRRAG